MPSYLNLQLVEHTRDDLARSRYDARKRFAGVVEGPVCVEESDRVMCRLRCKCVLAVEFAARLARCVDRAPRKIILT